MSLPWEFDEAGHAGAEALRAAGLAEHSVVVDLGAVYSRNALHHLPDFWKSIALARVAALLAPGGVLRIRDLVYSFEPMLERCGFEIRATEYAASQTYAAYTCVRV